MKFSQSLGFLLASSVVALPAKTGVSDIDILNYALTLEHLEDAFYKEALKKFPESEYAKQGYSPRARFNIREIGADESSHVEFLTTVIKSLKGTPVKPCKYDFGLTDLKTFLAIAQILEGVGVSAYLGATDIIMDRGYLEPAGSILTVEARHNAYIRDNQLPTQSPFPGAFDTPLGLNQVYTLASAFITSCPKSNPKLPVQAYPALAQAANQKAMHSPGDTVTLDVGVKKLPKKLFAAFPSAIGATFNKVKVLKGGKQVQVKIPRTVAGQTYVVLTNSNRVIGEKTTVAGPAILSVTPPYAKGGFPS